MKKKLMLFILLAIVAMSLSGCNEIYPFIRIDTGMFADTRRIDIGSKYDYIGFDVADTSNGKDVILHFYEKEQLKK